jgi:transcriptional regulator with XRE-family HTH domain
MINGAKIKTAREEAGLSQKELAAKVGCANNTLSRIELGRMRASGRLARKIAEGLDTTIAALSDNQRRSEPPTNSQLERDVLQAIRSLPPEKRSSIRAYAMAYAQAWHEAKEKGWEH